MKKIYLFLFALVCTVGAWAQVATSVDDIKSGSIYTIKSARNAITWDGSDTKCVGATLDADSKNHQFVAIKIDGHADRFYFYNVGANKFMSKSGSDATLTDFNEVYWKIKTSGDSAWPLMIDAQDGDHFNFGGDKQITVDWWADADEGNKMQIAEVSVASEELLEVINAQIAKGDIIVAAQNIVNGACNRVGAYPTSAVANLSAAVDAFNGNKTDANFTLLEDEYKKVINNSSVNTLSPGEKFRLLCFDNGRGYMAYSTVEGMTHAKNVLLAGASAWTDKFPALDAAGVYADWAMVDVEGKLYIYNTERKQCITYGTNVTFSDAGTSVTYSAYEGTPTVFEFKFEGGGDNHLSFSPGYSLDQGPVRTWNGTDGGTKFYIEKIGSSVEEALQTEMREKITGAVVGKYDQMKNLEKFDILLGSVVVGPSEFANPEVINGDIDAASSVEDTYDAKKAFVAGESGQRLQRYLDMVAQYGALANIQFEVKTEYATLVLPCPSSVISGLKRSTCTSVSEDGVLALDLVEGTFEAKKPYIIQAIVGSKFTIIGWNKNTGNNKVATCESGVLTGVLEEGMKVPTGSYILSKYSDKIGFYRVAEGADYDAAQYRCYLTLPASEARYGVLFFEGGEETGIDNVTETGIKNYNGTVYNMAGQRLNGLQKGLNIVNGKIVLK